MSIPRISPERTALLMALGVALAGTLAATRSGFADFFFTRDQQGEWLERHGNPGDAAKRYADPFRAGVAAYRAGDFKLAATAFMRASGGPAHFNRANAMVMLGDYQRAVAAYKMALDVRPDWRAAQENLALARRRLALRHPDADPAEQGNQLEPDEIVFEQGKLQNGTPTAEETAISAAELEALWLRRLDPNPAAYLRARFAYDIARRANQEAP